jgi:hypothetical protein
LYLRYAIDSGTVNWKPPRHACHPQSRKFHGRPIAADDRAAIAAYLGDGRPKPAGPRLSGKWNVEKQSSALTLKKVSACEHEMPQQNALEHGIQRLAARLDP